MGPIVQESGESPGPPWQHSWMTRKQSTKLAHSPSASSAQSLKIPTALQVKGSVATQYTVTLMTLQCPRFGCRPLPLLPPTRFPHRFQLRFILRLPLRLLIRHLLPRPQHKQQRHSRQASIQRPQAINLTTKHKRRREMGILPASGSSETRQCTSPDPSTVSHTSRFSQSYHVFLNARSLTISQASTSYAHSAGWLN